MLKIALCFYLAAVVLVIIAGVVLWLIADAAGAIHNIEKFMGKILSSKNYHLVSAQILEGTMLVGLVLAALMTIITVVGAALYNLFSELVGGFEVTLVETDHQPVDAARVPLGPGANPAGNVLVPHGAIAQPVRAHP